MNDAMKEAIQRAIALLEPGRTMGSDNAVLPHDKARSIIDLITDMAGELEAAMAECERGEENMEKASELLNSGNVLLEDARKRIAKLQMERDVLTGALHVCTGIVVDEMRLNDEPA